MQYPEAGVYPVEAPHWLRLIWRGKVAPSVWYEISEQGKTTSIRKMNRFHQR